MWNELSFTSCLTGVCTPLESLTLFQHINKKMTYSDIYNWATVVTLKDREMFSLKLANVAPAGECATSVNCAKNCFVLSADVETDCNTSTSVSHAFGGVELPAGWFLIRGRTVYSYFPANSSEGPCCLGD